MQQPHPLIVVTPQLPPIKVLQQLPAVPLQPLLPVVLKLLLPLQPLSALFSSSFFWTAAVAQPSPEKGEHVRGRRLGQKGNKARRQLWGKTGHGEQASMRLFGKTEGVL